MKKNLKSILIISILAVLTVAATLLVVFKDKLFSISASEEYTFINPDETRAETDEGMKIDGVLDELVYSQNTWTYLHNANGGNTVDMAVTSHFGEKGIYFAYEVRENTPIYVNMNRSTWMNSCIEMYLVPSNVDSMVDENVFEIDLLPNGYLLFKRPNAAGGWSDVTTTNDKMAYLGATTHGGEVNTEECTGYNLELFIPYDYLELLGIDTDLVKTGHLNVNPCHITSYNETGTDGSVDRFWYSFATQLGGDGWNEVNRFFKFNKDGAMNTVENEFAETQNCTISGKPTAIPGLDTIITVTPDKGYALTSIKCNEEELIRSVNYNEDGSVTLTLTATNDGFQFTAKAEPITEGKKTVKGVVKLQNIFGDSLEGVSARYEDESGQHKLEIRADGGFELNDIAQGYYVIQVKKDGYIKTERTLCVNRNMDIVIELPYDLFEVVNGNCWNVSKANEGELTKINGRGVILTKDLYGDFYIEANFQYSEELFEEFTGDDYQQQRIGFRAKFDNGKYWHTDLLRQNDGKYHLQFGKIMGDASLFNWDLVHELTESQITKYKSEEGIKLGVLRVGRTAYIYLDNQFVGQADLGKAQENSKAQVGFESFVANAKVMTINYKFDIKTPNAVVLTDAESVGARVSLGGKYKVGEDATIFIQKVSSETGAKLLSVQVNGKEMVQDVIADGKGYKLVLKNNLDKNLSVKVVYAKPSLTSAVIDTKDVNADGIAIRLLQDGAVKATSVVNNGKAVFSSIYKGSYEVQVKIYNIWTFVNQVTILDNDNAVADVKTLFETTEHINYTGTVNFKGTETKHFSIATDISGDAWFTMKVKVDEAQLNKVAANKGNIRLGYRMFFGGENGNYEWDNEYEITMKYTSEGKWIFEQMQTWEGQEIPEEMVNALTKNGLYLALNRDAESGVLTLYYGATEKELQSGKYFCKWETALQKQKENIKRVGVGFWSEKGSDYQSTVSDLSYGTTLNEVLGIKEVTASLNVLGHKDGNYSPLAKNTEVILQSAIGNYRLMTDANGTISSHILPGTYTISADGYVEAEVQISKSGLQGEVVLEYDLFNCPTGWDVERHDLSNVNASTPNITMNGGTMNVITNDSFDDVSASLYVKESNSTHSAHTQGIWIRFEDGKYMILYQEDAKLSYMKELWDFDTVRDSWKEVCAELPETVLQKWQSEGYELKLLRKDNQLYVIADGHLCDVETLPTEYADDTVEIGFFAYDSAATASWKFSIESDISEFTIECEDSENGVAKADKKSAGLGETVTITTTPDAGYVLKSIKVNGIERILEVIDGKITVIVADDLTIEATFASGYINATLVPNRAVENGIGIRLLQNGEVQASGVFENNKAVLEHVYVGVYDVEIQAFNVWTKLSSIAITNSNSSEIDVTVPFENSEFVDFDGSISFEGNESKHCSVGTNISGDAWFTMKVRIDKEQLETAAANKNNIRLGYRMFFGGESGNYLWDNEYEITMKYTAEGQWGFEQMQTWEGWYALTSEMVQALTGEGLYMALHRDAESGILTLYCGATEEEIIAGTNSFQWSSASGKQKENITRFGAGFWSENGSDYKATVTNLRYGASLTEVLGAVDATFTINTTAANQTAIRLTQNGQEKVVGTIDNQQVVFEELSKGSYQVEMKVFNAWTVIDTVSILNDTSILIDVTKPFEDANCVDFDGNIDFTGTSSKHYSVTSDISGNAWFALKLQIDKTQFEAVAANKGNIRLGYRMYFGGEAGNTEWANEYEVTLKCNGDGKWAIEQMQSWEGWNYYLSDEMISALTGEGLYMALKRDVTSGALTLYYGATAQEVLDGRNSFQWTTMADKQKENITRFGVGFWSENGSDYKANVTALRYGKTLEEALNVE